MRNALSVDVEDWFQVGAFENVIDRQDWETLDRRVEANTDRVLELFDTAGVKGTFFTLSWVADRHPALIHRIVQQGHEIASHGIDHKRVFQMTRAEFLADIKHSKAILEQASSQSVSGYRAPSFSVDPRTPWAHEALVEAGFGYSSSVAPIAHDHYGWPEAPRFGWHPVHGSDFIELPVTTGVFAGRRLAAGGGGFFRLLPYGFSRWAIKQVNSENHAAIFYFHPWEVDPDQPRVANAPLRSKLRHYTNLRTMAGKLDRLAREFSWGRVDAVAAEERRKLA